MDETREITKKVLSNSFIQVAGKVVTTLLSLLITATIARSLGVYSYGEFATVFAYLAIFGVISDFGFFQIMIRELARRPTEQVRILGNIFTMRSLFGLVIYGSSVLLVTFLPYSSAIKTGIAILAGASFLLSINTTLLGVFQAHHRMDKAVVGDVISRIFLLGGILWATSHGWNLAELFWLYLGANLTNLLITLTFLKQMIALKFSYELSEWKNLLKETIPMGLVIVSSVIYFRIDTVILSFFHTPAEVGIYSAPYKIVEILIFIPGIFMGNILPALSKLLENQKDKLRQLLQINFDILSILACGSVVGLSILAPQIIQLIAGEEFRTSSTFTLYFLAIDWPIAAPQILAILALPVSIIFYTYFWGTILIATRQQSRLIFPNIIAVVLNIVLNLIFIPRGSYFAAAITTIVTELYVLVATIRLVRTYLPIGIRLDRFWKIAASALLMGLVIWPIRDQMLFIPLVAGGAVYLVSLWLSGVLSKDVFGRLARG